MVFIAVSCVASSVQVSVCDEPGLVDTWSGRCRGGVSTSVGEFSICSVSPRGFWRFRSEG